MYAVFTCRKKAGDRGNIIQDHTKHEGAPTNVLITFFWNTSTVVVVAKKKWAHMCIKRAVKLYFLHVFTVKGTASVELT